jgi:CRP-like cAMP-binding protein
MNLSREAPPIQQALEHWTKNREDLALGWTAAATRTTRYRPLALVLSGWLLQKAGRDASGRRAVEAGFTAAIADGDPLVAVVAATLCRGDHANGATHASAQQMSALAALSTRASRPPPMTSAPRVEPLGAVGDQLLNEAESCVDQAASTAENEASGASATAGFLTKLDGPSLQALAEVGSLKLIAAGDQLIRQGEAGTEAFVIVRGELEVQRLNSPSVRVGTGALVGEIALLTDVPRGADVIATQPSLVLVVGRGSLAALLEGNQKLADAFARSLRDRLLENLFTINPILRRASASDRAALLAELELKSFATGETLIAQDSESTGLFFIAAGRVRILHDDGHNDGDDDGEPLEIAQVGTGDTVGEVALLLRRPATAAVVAQTTVVALQLAPERVLAALRPLPELFVELYALALAREKETTEISEAETGEAHEIILV